MPESLRYDCLYGVALPYTFTLFVYMMRFIHMMRIFYTVMLAFTFATLMRESPVKPSSILESFLRNLVRRLRFGMMDIPK